MGGVEDVEGGKGVGMVVEEGEDADEGGES